MKSLSRLFRKCNKRARQNFSDEEIDAALHSSGLIDGVVPKAVRELLTAHFDGDYYCRFNSDVNEHKVEPLHHYLSYGWREGRNPNPTFSTIEYLAKHPNLLISETNPLLHYVLAESTNGTPLGNDQYIQRMVSPYFDKDYYLMNNPDVAETDSDALKHYLDYGWHEKRNPSPTFDTAFYLAQHPDAVDLKINPLLHYARLENKELQLTQHPIRKEIQSIIKCLHEKPKKTSENHNTKNETNSTTDTNIATNNDNPDINNFIADACASSRKRIVISVSHDIYTENCGGIQNFISDEQKKFNNQDSTYINISPATPTPSLSANQSAEAFCTNIVIDGNTSQQLTFASFQNSLLAALKKNNQKELLLVIHSLLGHNTHLIRNLAEAISNPMTALFWIHDYFSLCPSYALMRNRVEFCGAPLPERAGCRICAFNDSRNGHSGHMKELFDNIAFTMVAPSTSALELWLSRTPYSFEKALVHPHVSMKFTHKRKKLFPADSTDKGLNICYAGYPDVHKGWLILQSLLDAVWSADSINKFYHFSTEQSFDHRLLFRPARTGKDSKEAMTTAIQDQDIDIAIIPALWPESFCYVAYEALAAGCIVVTLESSGHVATLAKEVDQVIAFRSEEALIKAFSDGSLYERAKNMLTEGLSVPDLNYCGTSATLNIVHKESHP